MWRTSSVRRLSRVFRFVCVGMGEDGLSRLNPAAVFSDAVMAGSVVPVGGLSCTPSPGAAANFGPPPCVIARAVSGRCDPRPTTATAIALGAIRLAFIGRWARPGGRGPRRNSGSLADGALP